MRFNFKKIAAIGASVLLAGLTTGFAAATPFPAPFVQNGVTNNPVIVVGTGAASSDVTEAGQIMSSLQSYLGSSGSASLGGNSLPLDQGGSSRIWLNTSLTTAKSIYTSTDLPGVLGSSVFSGGSTTATITQTLTLGAGNIGSGTNFDNSGKVIYDKMPTSNNDPSVGLSLPVSNNSVQIYNESITFSSPINFTSSSVQGQTMTLFGNQYTVSTASSSSAGIVLYSSAQTVNLNQGNSTTVIINGASHTISLTGGISSTQVQLTVDGVAGTVTVGSTQLINGVNVGVTSAFPSSGVAGGSATVLVGANQLTLQNATAVQVGSSNAPIMGTMVTLTGAVNATTGINIGVEAPNLQNASVLKGQAFVDPVFGTFQIYNGGLSIPTNSTARDIIKVGTSGATAMTLAYTDLNNYSNTFTFANNASGWFNLSTTSYQIYPYEMANLSLYGYTLTGTGSQGQLDGHLLQLINVYNSSGGLTTYSTSGYLNDYVQYMDVMSGQTYKTLTPTAVGSAPLIIDGRQYTVTYGGPSGGTDWAELKFPTSDSASTSYYVVYPALSTAHGGQLVLYEPLTLNMTNWSATDGPGNGGIASNLQATGILLPNGAGYTLVTIAAVTSTGANWNYTISGGSTTVGQIGNITGNYTNLTAGNLKFNLSYAGANLTNLTMYSGGTGTNLSYVPAVVLIEAKDINSNQSTVTIPLAGGAGTGSSGVGVGTPVMSAATQFTASYVSNTNLIGYIDYFGTHIIKDSTSSAQPIATLYYPQQQVYEQLYIGPLGNGTTASGGSLGNIIVKDSQASSFSNSNMIVVGGSCINSAAATLVGGAYCGSAWTAATGLGSGQFLIQSYNGAPTATNKTYDNGLTSGVALLVAGTDAPDTINAATFLIMQKPDTSIGNQYLGNTTTTTVASSQFNVLH